MAHRSIDECKNRRPLRTQRMRDEGWEGRPLSVPVSLIFKAGEVPGGRPSKQPVERDLDNAIALMYAGLFTLLRARDRRDHERPVEPQAVRDIRIASGITVSWGLPFCHEHLMKLAKRACRSDPRFSSFKAFSDAYRSIGARRPANAESRALEEASIAEQIRILDLLCKAAERARQHCKGWREAQTNVGRFGEARSDRKPSALERCILLSPRQQISLKLSLEDMRDVATYGWVNPASICLDHHILSPVFEVVICASRNRAGVPGQITRFSAAVFILYLTDQIEKFAADKEMQGACVGLYMAALHAFNDRLQLSIYDLASILLQYLDAALAGSGDIDDYIVIFLF